jgi:hypothetical protein
MHALATAKGLRGRSGVSSVAGSSPVCPKHSELPGGIGHLGIAAAAYHPLAQPQQVMGQIGAVLAGDAGDQGCFH